MPRRVSLQTEYDAIVEASCGRSLTTDEVRRIERINEIARVRKSRLPRQIEATRAKLARLEAQYRG